MTHRFFVDPSHIQGDEVHFVEAQEHQLRSVLRLRPGDQVRVFDGVLPHDFVVELGATLDRGAVVGRRPHAPEPRTRLVVYPALLQRDKFESVLQKLTEVGASAIAPVVTSRGVVREPPDERRYARWSAILREAAEQSGRGSIPRLLPVASLTEALRDGQGRLILAYEGERRRDLHAALADCPSGVALFVGPEGGYAVEEIDAARRAGAEVISLGPRVLRTETASPLLAALVLYELGDLSWPADQQV
jgi:16S rRNA (uracil1498-N3)-methyltransferase